MNIKRLILAIAISSSALLVATHSAAAAEFKQWRNSSIYACATSKEWAIRNIFTYDKVGSLKVGECAEVIDEINTPESVLRTRRLIVKGGKSGQARALILNYKEVVAFLSMAQDGYYD